MKRSFVIGAGLIAALLWAAPVSAGPSSGTTNPIGTPTSGSTLDVQVSIRSISPVVPYEYAIQNECDFPGKKESSIQQDDIVSWTFVDGGDPSAIMPIYLQSVPSGSKCKVFLVHGNTTVKGSTTSYTVS